MFLNSLSGIRMNIWRKNLGVLILGIFLMSFLFAGVVSAEDSVSDALSNFVNSANSYDDISIVYGDNAAVEDIMGTYMLSNLFPIFDMDEGRSPYVKKASEVSLFQNKNLILIGGPCANLISEEITDEKGYNCDDWKFDYGKAVVKVFDNGEGKAIMIAGTTKEDTSRITEAIIRYDKSEKLKSSDEVIFETPVEGECGNNICEIKETDKNCPLDCSNEESFRLTSGLGVKTLDVSGDYVTFHDGNLDVYLQNLKTKELKKIGQGSWPQIDGDYVVYEGKENVMNENTGNYVEWPTIKLYQISTDETISLTEAKIKYYFSFPIIFGDGVVWLETNEVSGDTNPPKLMIYSIDDKTTEKLVDVRGQGQSYHDSNFKMEGNYIVYQGPKYCVPEDCSQVQTQTGPDSFLVENAEEGDSDIWLYDIAKDKKIRLTSDEEYQGMPEIWSHYVVWVDEGDVAEGNKEIYLYDILTGEERALSLTYDVPRGTTALSFSDYNVIWTDLRNGNKSVSNEDVYFYDIQGDTERRITFTSDSQGGGILDGNYVVWIDHRNGGQDLYMKDLSFDSISKEDICALGELEVKTCVYDNINYKVKRKTGCEFEINNEKIILEPLSQTTLSNGVKVRKDASSCNFNNVVLEFR